MMSKCRSLKGLWCQEQINKSFRKCSGNTTVLVICVIGVLVLLGLFALNYSHLFQQNIEGRNAAEATALQVARDLGRVVYTAPSGKQMALLDQPLGLGNNGQTSAAPIEGFNTMMAHARLGSVFAHKCGNGVIEYLAEQEVASRASDIVNFNAQFSNLTSNPFKDAQGRTIDFQKNAEDTYIRNLRMRGKDENDYIKGSLKITLLYAVPNLNLSTNVPIPNNFASGNSDQEAEKNYITVNGTKRYKAYTAYGVTDLSSMYSIDSSGNGTVVGSVHNPAVPAVFTGTGDVPVILENDSNKFIPWTPATNITSLTPSELGRAVPPAIVQVTVSEHRHKLNETENQQADATVTHTATAQVGGPNMTYPPGTLCVGMPAGIPQGIAFHSVISIMNYSQAKGAFGPNTSSAYAHEQGTGLLAGLQLNGWNPNSIGHWFQDRNSDGSVGPPYGHIGGGKLTLNANDVPSGVMNHSHTFQGRQQHDDPSVAMSTLVYHWLRAQSLNADVTSLFQALALSGNPSTNPADYTKNNFVEMMKQGDASKPVTKMNFSANADLLTLPAYAETAAGSAGAATGFTLQMGAISNAIQSMGSDKTLMEQTGGASLQNDMGINDPRFMLNHGNSTLTNSDGVTDTRTKVSQDKDEIQLAFGDVDHAVVAPPRSINFAIQPPTGTGNQVQITGPDGKPLPAIDFQAGTLSTAQVSVGGFKGGTAPDGTGEKPWGSFQHALAVFGNASGIAVQLPAEDKSGFANFPDNKGEGLTTLYPSGTDTTDEVTLADGSSKYKKYSIATLAANIGYDASYINKQANSLTDKSDKTKIQDAMSKNDVASTTEILPMLEIIKSMNKVTWNSHTSNSDTTASDVRLALTAITTSCDNIDKMVGDLLKLSSFSTASNADKASPDQKAAYHIKQALNEIRGFVVKDDLPSSKEPRDNIPGLCEIKRRALCVVNNAIYISGITEKIVDNQQALTGLGLSETSSTKFSLANNDFFPIPSSSVATEDKIENIGANPKIPTNQDSTTNVDNNWLVDLPSGVTNYDGTKSQLKVYSRSAAAPVNVNIGHYRYGDDRWMQAALAQAAPPPNAVTTDGARRMFIFGMNPSNGQFYVTSSPNTPYVKTGILNGQYVYQNPAGVKQYVQSVNDFLYWLVEARDLNAGDPNAAYFADDSNVTDSQGNKIQLGNDFEKDWCKGNPYTGTQLPLPSGGTTNQTSYQVVNGDMSFGGNCQHVVAEFRIGCPILGTQCTARGTQPELDGHISSSQPGCDTPPPCSS